MTFIEKEDGTQIVVFHLHGGGFHITKHPLGANPHIRVPKKALSQELDLAALRGIDWASMEPEFKSAFESKFYWPQHRADLVAIPGPPGKTWHEGVTEVFRGPEIDVIEMFRCVLGYGTLYKVGYGDRNAFFATDLGRGSLIWDKKDRRWAFWVGGPFAAKPLFGLRVDDSPFLFRMPEPLEQWQATMNYEMEIGAEEFFEARAHEFEKDFEAIMPELQEFMQGFKIVKWKPANQQNNG